MKLDYYSDNALIDLLDYYQVSCQQSKAQAVRTEIKRRATKNRDITLTEAYSMSY